jgi:TonB family protein
MFEPFSRCRVRSSRCLRVVMFLLFGLVAVHARGWCGVPSVVVTPPDPSDPKFGDYIYVEELPEAITKVPPTYPDAARRAHIEGTVMVQALVGKDGRIHDTKIVKSIPELDEAAVAAVRQWIFKPALANHEPVAVWVAVPVKFSLDGGGILQNLVPRYVPPPPKPSPQELAPPRRSGGAAGRLQAMLEQLRANPVAPSPRDALLRERIIRAWRRLDRNFDREDTAQLDSQDQARARYGKALESGAHGAAPKDLEREIAAVLVEAPWWAEPYREMAHVQERLGDLDGAAVSLELYLVADPDAHDWEDVRMEIKRLRPRIADWY